VNRTRWTLAHLLQTCAWLDLSRPSSLWRLLDRLEISYKQARDHVHSPDPDYLAKLAFVQQLRERVAAAGGREVLLYQDELTYYRQPTGTQAWEARGRVQPRAERSCRSNTATRIAAALEASSGRVVYWQGSSYGLEPQLAFYRHLCAAFPGAARLWLVQDNWPVHVHPDLLVALERQEHPWPYYRPPSWPTEPSPTAQRRWGELHLPIQLVPLPTYASWTNPIEKLWRKGRQEVLHLHRLANQLEELRQQMRSFLDQFAHGSPELLRYVGLALPG
jgi:hypothetical protein